MQTAVLRSTNAVVDGATETSAAGVHTYITVATGAVVAAGVVAVILVRRQRRTKVATDVMDLGLAGVPRWSPVRPPAWDSRSDRP